MPKYTNKSKPPQAPPVVVASPSRSYLSWIVLGVGLFVIWLVNQINTSDEPQRPDGQAPKMVNGGPAPVEGALFGIRDLDTGNETPIFHLMGPEPLNGQLTISADKKERVDFTDDDFFRVVSEATDLMGPVYGQEWRKWLEQTTWPLGDSRRNWYVLLHTVPYQSDWAYATEAQPGDHNVGGRFVPHPSNNGQMAMVLMTREMVQWEDTDKPRKLFTAMVMVHEMRHQQDFLNRKNLLWRGTDAFNQAMVASEGKGGLTEEDLLLYHSRAVEVLARETIAYEVQFLWAEKHAPELVAEEWFTKADLWQSWKKGGRKALMSTVYSGYQEEIWLPEVIRGKVTEPEKQKAFSTALELIDKVYESGGGPAV